MKPAKDSLLPVKEPILEESYHVSWAFSHGVVGICKSIDYENKTVRLQKPRGWGNFKHPVKWKDLRHTRANEAVNPH